MRTRNRPTNPFYIILVIAGVTFCITACAYGVLIVHGLRAPDVTPESDSGRWLLAWLDKNGAWLMICELTVLGICTFAAIGTDGYWTRRFMRKRDVSNNPNLKHTEKK